MMRGWAALHDRVRTQAKPADRLRKEKKQCQPLKLLLQELEQEAQTTRRVLERVPGDRWRGSRMTSRCRSVSSRCT
jgi:hypothetical protein